MFKIKYWFFFLNMLPFYKTKKEVIKYEKSDNGTLEIEFRTIDTNNPFNRNTKSNWSGTTNSSTNNKVQQYITNSDVNNSYNRTGQGSLYQIGTTGKIVLTPSLIQSIREYNETYTYDDYTVYTTTDENGNKTISTSFFDYIGLTKVQ